MVIAVVSVFGKKRAHKQKALRAKVTGAATNIYADVRNFHPHSYSHLFNKIDIHTHIYA